MANSVPPPNNQSSGVYLSESRCTALSRQRHSLLNDGNYLQFETEDGWSDFAILNQLEVFQKLGILFSRVKDKSRIECVRL